jgi:sugar phosphate isomerase/epimerase
MTSRTDLNRRTFMRLAGSTVAIGAATLAASPAASAVTSTSADPLAGGRRLVAPGKLGIQLFSIRDKVSSLGFRVVFERLAEMGYSEVEFAGYSQGGVGPITPQEIRQLLDDNGLTAVGGHRGINDFARNIEAELDIAETLGMKHIGTANAPTGNRTIAGYLAAAEQFNGFGAAAAARGLKFYQHNHQHEFAFANDDPSVRLYDVFLENTDPSLVFLEMDVYWAHVGKHIYPGFEPVEYVLANRKRYPLFHLKDGRVNPNVGNGYDIVEFGAGDIDYQGFLSALGGTGRQHGIWEQDNASTSPREGFERDSFGNAERSAEEILGLRATPGS